MIQILLYSAFYLALFNCSTPIKTVHSDIEVIKPRPKPRVDTPSRQDVESLLKPVSVTKKNITGEVEKPVKSDWYQEFLLIITNNSKVTDRLNLVNQHFDQVIYQKLAGVEQIAKKIREQNPKNLQYLDYWLLEKLWEQQKYDEASRFATQLFSSDILEIRSRAEYLYEQYYVVRKASAKSIGVLVPAGNKSSEVLINALKMALGHTNEKESPFKIVLLEEPEESKDFDNKFSEFIRNENVIAIIGGLKTKSRHEIARLVSQYQVPFLYMGPKSRVVDESPYLYQYGLTNESQVRVLAQYARQTNIQKVAIVYPNDGFGVEAANLFWDEWLSQGGEVTAAFTYHPNENDFQELAAKLSSKFDLAPRMPEFKKLQLEKIEKDPTAKKKILSQTPAELLPAIYNYDAIFIPDIPKSTAKLTASLAYFGVRRLPILSTRLLVHNDTYKLLGPMWAPYLIIPDSIYNHLELFGVQHPFIYDYKQKYGLLPDHLAVSTFEVATMIKSAIAEGVDSREGLNRYLRDQGQVKATHGFAIGFDEYRELDAPISLLKFDDKGNFKNINSPFFFSF